MAADSIQTLRGIGIAVLWMGLPAILSATPLLYPSMVGLLWMLGLLGCVIVPVIAGIVHRSRGIGYICGGIGAAIVVFLAPFALLRYFVSQSV